MGQRQQRRYWINVSLPHRAAKKRYEKAAKAAGMKLATFARQQLDKGADDILGPDPHFYKRDAA